MVCQCRKCHKLTRQIVFLYYFNAIWFIFRNFWSIEKGSLHQFAQIKRENKGKTREKTRKYF